MNALHTRSHATIRTALALTIVGALAIGSRAAAAQSSKTSFGVSGGLAIPVGSYTNGLSTGYNIGVSLGMASAISPMGFRAEAMYNQENWQGAGNEGISHRVAAGTANLTYDLSGTSAASSTGGLYLIGGLGIYGSYDRGGFMDGSPTTTKAGVNGGGGWRMPLSDMNVYLEARYHYIFGTGEQLIPITVGVTF